MAVAARIPRPRARGESHAGRGHAPPHAQRRGCGHGREPGLTSAQAAALWGGRPVCREWPDAAAPDPGVTAEPSAPRSAPRSPRRERRSQRCPPLPCPLGTLRRPSPLSCLSSPRSAEIRAVWHGPPATAGQRGPTAGVSRVTRLGRGPQGRAPLRGWGRCWQWGWAGEACAALCRAPSRRASPGAHGVPVQHQLGELLPLFLDVGDLHLGGRERQGGEPRGAGAARSRAPCLLRLFFSQAKFTPSVYSPYFQKAAPAGGAQGGREARTSAMLHSGSTTSLSTKTSCCDSSRASWFSASPHVSSIFLQTTGTRSPVRPPRTRGARSAEYRAAADGDATRPGPPARGAPAPSPGGRPPLTPAGTPPAEPTPPAGSGRAWSGAAFSGRQRTGRFSPPPTLVPGSQGRRGGERPTAAWGPRGLRCQHPAPEDSAGVGCCCTAAAWPLPPARRVHTCPALGTADGQTPR